MRTIQIATVLGAAMLLMAAPVTAANASFDYSSEGLRSREVVKQEYGENPLEAIRAAILDRDLDYKAWRRAVAAAAFLGEAGVEELLTHLKPALARREYGQRTEALLDSAGRIIDRRVLELTVDILESKDTSAGMRQLKLQASGIAKKQVEGASWSLMVDHSSEGLSRIRAYPIGGSMRSGDSYSSGLRADRECMLAVRARLAALMDGLRKQDAALAEKVSEVIAAIDRKEERIRKCLESVPIPQE